MKKRVWLIAAAVIFAAAIACVCIALRPSAPEPLSTQEMEKLRGPRDDVRIEAAFVPESRSMHVKQHLRLTSRTDESRENLILRTWPNAYQSPSTSPLASEAEYAAFYPEGFSMGALVMQSASLEEESGTARRLNYRYLDEAKTVLSLPLDRPWQPGETLLITLEYTLILPKAASRYGAWDGIYSFGNAFPLPAVWEEGEWRTDEFSLVGDPFYSDVYDFDVTVTSPASYLCAAPGLPVSETKDGGSISRNYHLTAARDFALCFSENYRLTTVRRGGLTVQAFTRNASEGRKAARFALKALTTYSGLYGPYPYRCFTLAEIAFPHSGMEYPGMMLISGDVLAAGGDTAERVIAHECAHQWWYSLVGSDPVNNAWQDEALCEFSFLSYWEKHHGKNAAEEIFRREMLPSLQVTYTATTGSPLSWFSDTNQYRILVYERGAAMLRALDDMMQGGLNGFLKHYRECFAFDIASREDFFSLLQEYSGEDYAPLLTDYLDTLIAP